MKAILVIALISLVFGNPIFSKDYVNELKKIAPFQVYEPEENPFRDYTHEEIKALLGDWNAGEKYENPEPKKVKILNDLPEAYDWRKEFPKCEGPIKDQASCGSCWAFAGSEALEHRFCTKGGEYVQLSAQNLVSCDHASMGCQGGGRSSTWDFFQKTGIVTEDCWPYSSGEGDVEPCITKCKNGDEWKPYKVTDYKGFSDVNSIKEELVANGPIHTGFKVYSDFMNYKGGIYQHVSGFFEGGHAVVFVGWGTEDGIDYWICQNSWGEWGESGYFRIKMGECDIDVNSWAGTPDL